MEENFKKLNESLQEQEDGVKRNGEIEKNQLSILLHSLKKVQKFFSEYGVEIDTSRINNMRKHENWVYLDKEGVLRSKQEEGYTHEKNQLLDSKYFDAVVPVNVKGHTSVIYFMLKGLQGDGGQQNDSMREMATLSEYLIPKNKDENVYFIFQFDGNYTEKCIKDFPIHEKTSVTNSRKMDTVLTNVISNFIEAVK